MCIHARVALSALVVLSGLIAAASTRVVKHGGVSHGSRLRQTLLLARGNRGPSPTCGEDFPAPHEDEIVVCPSACPLLVQDLDQLCSFKCITKEECLEGTNMPVAFVNEDTHTCEACMVPGCHRCGGNAKSCAECKTGFDVVDEECVPHSRFAWRCVYIALAVIALFIVVYVICLACRPVTHEKALEQGLEYRSESKPRSDLEGHPVYPITTNLCNDFVTGVGVMLHFRFEKFWLYWSMAICFILWVIPLYHTRLGNGADVLSMPPHHEDALSACADLTGKEKEEIEDIRIQFMYTTGAIYVLSTVACIWFAIRQRRLYKEETDEMSSMADFALLAHGLPIETGKERLEEQYKKYFEETFGTDTVVGVSICWNYFSRLDEVQKCTEADACLLETEAERAERAAHAERGECTADARRNCCLDPQMRCLDGIFWGTPCGDAGQEDTAPTKPVKELLDELPCSGKAFVVLKTEATLVRALKTKLPKYKGEHEVWIEHYRCDAHTINFQYFDITREDRYRRIIIGFFVLLAIILFWTVCFYGPYAWYLLSYSGVAGMSQGDFIQGTLLGLVITVGNQIVYYACVEIAERAHFRNRDNRDFFEVMFYTFAVFLNTVFDIWLVWVMSTSYIQDSKVDAQAITRNPTMQQALYVQFMGYLYPGTLLIPFLLEPLPLAIAPYYLGCWLVRSRRTKVSRRDAEGCLMCCPMDLNRYGDILVNVVLVVMCFFLTSLELWWIFFQLAISNAFIYIWDDYRFLRQCCETHFNTQRMDIVGHYLAAVPNALLAAAFVFKLYGGQAMVATWDRHEFFAVRAVWVSAGLAFVVHLVAHCLFLKYGVPRIVPPTQEREKNEVPYEKVAEEIACNYFNTNPVHCLRSRHVYGHTGGDDPPFVPFEVGKYYLQKKNPKIAAYYEATKYQQEESFVQDLGAVGHFGVDRLKYSLKGGGRKGRMLWNKLTGRGKASAKDQPADASAQGKEKAAEKNASAKS